MEDDESEDGETYEGVICHACGQLHLVNPKTGETLGGDDKWTDGNGPSEFLQLIARLPASTVSALSPCA